LTENNFRDEPARDTHSLNNQSIEDGTKPNESAVGDVDCQTSSAMSNSSSSDAISTAKVDASYHSDLGIVLSVSDERQQTVE
jgi:hypothetical protein